MMRRSYPFEFGFEKNSIHLSTVVTLQYLSVDAKILVGEISKFLSGNPTVFMSASGGNLLGVSCGTSCSTYSTPYQSRRKTGRPYSSCYSSIFTIDGSIPPKRERVQHYSVKTVRGQRKEKPSSYFTIIPIA